jgi:hypothetical protein
MSDSKNKSLKNDIALEEWDFSKVSKEEKRACFYYEYLRQYFLKIPINKTFPPNDHRRFGDAISGVKLFDKEEKDSNFRASGIGLIVEILDLPEFPQETWQSLPTKIKNLLIRGVWEGFVDYPPFFEFQCQPHLLEQKAAQIRKQFKVSENNWVLFNLPNGWPVEEIIKDFSSALYEYKRENPTKFYRPLGRRGGPGDKLKQLGALRLLKYFKAKALKEYTKCRLKENVPLYSDEHEFHNAAKQAKETLKKMVGNSSF